MCACVFRYVCVCVCVPGALKYQFLMAVCSLAQVLEHWLRDAADANISSRISSFSSISSSFPSFSYTVILLLFSSTSSPKPLPHLPLPCLIISSSGSLPLTLLLCTSLGLLLHKPPCVCISKQQENRRIISCATKCIRYTAGQKIWIYDVALLLSARRGRCFS